MKLIRLVNVPVVVAVVFVTAICATGQSQPAGKIEFRECIAIMAPTVSGMPGDAQQAASGVRDLVTSYLAGPNEKIIALEAKLPVTARDEAKEKSCQSILFITVTKKTGGRSFMHALGQGAAASSWRLPGGSSVASAAASATAAAGLQAASAMATSTKAKDEIRFEYRLESVDGNVTFGPKTETQSAKTDGEDLLTPVVARAAQAIVGRITS
jgi:hypothetical protein